jgi:ADP-heptose:LPS heptosyltransferase
VIVHGGREPMGRRDKFGIELLPAPEAFDAALDALHDCFLVRIGKGDEIYSLRADLDLSNRTSVADVMDIAAVSSGIVAQCSFAVPLAEALDKPLLAIWSARGLASNSAFIKTVTPSKILSKPGSHYVMDDEPAGKIEEAARAFRGVG